MLKRWKKRAFRGQCTKLDGLMVFTLHGHTNGPGCPFILHLHHPFSLNMLGKTMFPELSMQPFSKDSISPKKTIPTAPNPKLSAP